DGIALGGEVVADDEERAAGGDGAEQVAQAALVGGAVEGAVLQRDKVVGVRAEGVGGARITVQATDDKASAVGLGGDAGEGVAGDVAGGDLPALLGQPERVGSLAGTDVERSTGSQLAGLFHKGAVGVAAP